MFRGRAHNQIILFYSDFDSHTQRATLKFKWIKWEPLRVLMNINGLVTQVISRESSDFNCEFWSIPFLSTYDGLDECCEILEINSENDSLNHTFSNCFSVESATPPQKFLYSQSFNFGRKKIQFIEKANLALVTFWWWLNGMFDVTNCCVMLSQRY